MVSKICVCYNATDVRSSKVEIMSIETLNVPDSITREASTDKAFDDTVTIPNGNNTIDFSNGLITMEEDDLNETFVYKPKHTLELSNAAAEDKDDHSINSLNVSIPTVEVVRNQTCVNKQKEVLVLPVSSITHYRRNEKKNISFE